MGVASLGDRSLPAAVAGGALGGDETHIGHELLGRAEALEAAHLDRDPERCQGGDPAQAAQPADELAPRLRHGERRDVSLERLDPAVDQVERLQVGLEGELLGRTARSAGSRAKPGG